MLPERVELWWRGRRDRKAAPLSRSHRPFMRRELWLLVRFGKESFGSARCGFR